jgi:putative sigma-54 modulation protein
MKIISSFKKIEHTEALDQKLHEKSQKFEKYFEGNFEVQWTCYVNNHKQQCADVKIIGPQFEYHASAQTESLYKSFDHVVSKMERQIFKKKEKWKSKISKKHNHSIKDQFVSESEWDEQYWQDHHSEDIAS